MEGLVFRKKVPNVLTDEVQVEVIEGIDSCSARQPGCFSTNALL